MLILWLKTLVAELELFPVTRQYLALFILLSLEEAGLPLPLPGDMAIMFLGYRTTIGLANPLLVIPVVAAATFLGSSILYFVARRVGHPVVLRYGRYIRLDEKRLAKVEGWFAKHGALAIVLGRLIPGLRTPTSIFAGVFEVPYRMFAPATALSAFLWATIYMVLGILLGASYQKLIDYLLGDYRLVALCLALLLVLGVTLVWVARVLAMRRKPSVS